MTDLLRIEFTADGATLVGDVHRPDEPNPLGVVVLHPHPLYGGERHNNVTVGLAEGLARMGYAALRFDFRGAGESAGRHGGGEPEVADVAAAMAALPGWVPEVRRVAVVGYSFGAHVAALGAGRLDAAAIACVAPPVAMLECDGLTDFLGPLLLVAGDRDEFGPAPEVAALAESAGAELHRLVGGDHFLHGREAEVARLVVEFLDRVTEP